MCPRRSLPRRKPISGYASRPRISREHELVFRHPQSRSCPRDSVVYGVQSRDGSPARSCPPRNDGPFSCPNDVIASQRPHRSWSPNPSELVPADSLELWLPKIRARLATILDLLVAQPIELVSQRPYIWLPRRELVPQRAFRSVSRAKSRLKMSSHRLVARTMSNTSG